ncbi:MAG: hypothetical protein IKL89_07860 [Clostridia bacterium]|nr:hypothetical protein [Clostridia bacterium]
MKRFLSILLALIMVFSVVMPAAATEFDGSEDTADQGYTLEDYYSSKVGTPAEYEALFQAGAQSVQVGDWLLQADAGTGNFRITNLKTGIRVDSLPMLFTDDIAKVEDVATRADFFSDMNVDFFYNATNAMKQLGANDSGGTGSGSGMSGTTEMQTLNSFQDSVQKGQLKVSPIKNGFRLEYGFNETETVILPLAFNEEQFKKYTARIEDQEALEDIAGKYFEYDFDEIRTQRNYWAKMMKKDRNNDTYKANYESYNQQYATCVAYPGFQGIWDSKVGGKYYIYDPTSGNSGASERDLETVAYYWTHLAKITQEEYKQLCEDLNGYTNPHAKGGCTIPVELTIDAEGTLSYKILNDEITSGPGFYINYVTAARWVVSSFADEEGYLVVPSGSGAIIDNNSDGAVMTRALYQIGGTDNAKSQSAGIPYRQTNVLPVYGVVRNGTCITAVIESGIPHSAVDVEIGYPTWANALEGTKGRIVNRAALQYEMTLFDQVKVDGKSSNDQQAFQLFPRRVVDGLAYGLLPAGEFEATFHISTGNDANYTYMASVYRDKLLAKGMNEKAEAGENLPLMLDIFGCIDKSILVLGVPFEVKYALTDFEETQKVIEYLKTEAGVADVDMRLLGWINGGYFSTAPTKIKIQRQMGGAKGFASLLSYMNDNGYGFYPDVNLVTVYKDAWFDGYNSNKMTSKRIDFVYAILHGTDLVSGRTLAGWHSRFVISPRYYESVFESFRSQIDKKVPDLKSYDFSESGKTISSDFTMNKYLYRGDAAKLVSDFMAKFEEDGYSIATEVGCEYMLPYVDNIWRLPQSSSKLLIETEQIPLAQMVLHGSVVYCGEAINETQDDQLYILRCLEMGMSPYLEAIYTVDDDLKDTEFMDYFSLNYKNWTESVKKVYGEVNKVLADLQDKTIVDHAVLAHNVRKTTYEGGVSVIVNYNKEAYDYEGQSIPARGYVVIK